MSRGLQAITKLESAVGLLVLLFCLATAVTQVVNPFPHDEWFHS